MGVLGTATPLRHFFSGNIASKICFLENRCLWVFQTENDVIFLCVKESKATFWCVSHRWANEKCKSFFFAQTKRMKTNYWRRSSFMAFQLQKDVSESCKWSCCKLQNPLKINYKTISEHLAANLHPADNFWKSIILICQFDSWKISFESLTQ